MSSYQGLPVLKSSLEYLGCQEDPLPSFPQPTEQLWVCSRTSTTPIRPRSEEISPFTSLASCCTSLDLNRSVFIPYNSYYHSNLIPLVQWLHYDLGYRSFQFGQCLCQSRCLARLESSNAMRWRYPHCSSHQTIQHPLCPGWRHSRLLRTHSHPPHL